MIFGLSFPHLARLFFPTMRLPGAHIAIAGVGLSLCGLLGSGCEATSTLGQSPDEWTARERVQCPGIEQLPSEEHVERTGVLSPCSVNIHEASCNEASTGEAAFAYTAPTFGIYEFRATSDDFSPVFYLLEERADGEAHEIRCDADGNESSSGRIELQEGQELRLGVQPVGGEDEGAYTLTIHYLGQPWE